jgi:hypothetical protein
VKHNKSSSTAALKENFYLQASQQQILQETKAQKKKVCELQKQTTLEQHVACAEDMMCNK